MVDKNLKWHRGPVLLGQCKDLLLLQDLIFIFQIQSSLSRICWENTKSWNKTETTQVVWHCISAAKKRKEEKTVGNEWNCFLKVGKLHHPYWLLSCLYFTERRYQDIKNIPTGLIKRITQDHWFSRQLQKGEEKIAGSLQESEACKQRMISFVQKQGVACKRLM